MALRTAMARLKAHVPWWGKIAAKIVLTRLPLPYRFWKRIALLEHGAMERPAYALDVVRMHHSRVAAVRPLPTRFTALELGPGDTLFGGMASAALGAERVYLVDSGHWVAADTAACVRMAAHLREAGLPIVTAGAAASLEDVMEQCGIRYLTDGLRSLRTIPDASVNFIWSQAVLEHVPRAEFDATLAELRRVLTPGGLCSHQVDLRDHLAGSLHHLRFGTRLWESRFMARSGFYTNRIRHAEMLERFQRTGFAIIATEVQRWPALPIARRSLHAEFRALPDEELCVSGFSVVLGAA